MKSKVNVRFFPFSPGIPWKLKCGKYVLPDISVDSWRLSQESRDPVVIAYGGLIESFTSLAFFELLNDFGVKSKRWLWCGRSRFNHLVELNALANVLPNIIDEDTVVKYPVPIFMDRDAFTYFNCLNNYIDVHAYTGAYGYRDKRAIIRQIFEKSTQPWYPHYIPQLRKLVLPDDLNAWARISRFRFNAPYVCIFPDATGMSQHKKSFLGWDEHKVKAFGAIMKQEGCATVVITPNAGKYYNSAVYSLPPRLDYICYLLRSATAVLSEEVDFLLVAAMLSNAKLLSKISNDGFSLTKNCRFLKRSNVIYTGRQIGPVEAANFIRGDS